MTQRKRQPKFMQPDAVRHVAPSLCPSPRAARRASVLRAPHEQREGVAVTVDCDDGWRRYVEPARLRPALTVIDGGRR
jgi:hypothetical protein